MRTDASWLERNRETQYAYLTTTGRHSGEPRRIEIWFGVVDGWVYLLAGGRDRSHWVRNLQEKPEVLVEIGGEVHAGRARVVEPGTAEDRQARETLVAKYASGNNLDEWGRTALPVAISFDQ